MFGSLGRRPADPAEAAAGLLLRLGIAVLAIGVPCAAVVSRRPIIALMPIGAILVVIACQLAPDGVATTRRHLGAALRSPVVLILLFLVAWTGLSLIWTPFPDQAIARFLKSAGTVLLAAAAMACMSDHIKASNSNLLPIGVAGAALAIICVAIVTPAAAAATDPDGTTLQRATIGLVVLVWPALGALAVRERIASAGAIAIGVAITAVVIWMPSALIALILGMLVFSFAYSSPKATGYSLATIASVLILAAPAVPLGLQFLLAGRVDPEGLLAAVPVWSQIVRSEGLRLITGHGFDTSLHALLTGVLPPRTPRGILFDLWYELGFLGAAGAAALAWAAFSAAARAPRILAPFLLAAITCILTLSTTGLSLGQLWWLALLALTAIAFAIVLRAHQRTERVQARLVRESRPSL
jgi:hypothetical protein